MNKGKLIIIEGSDGSGKATQSQILFERLKEAGVKVRLISFPNYASDSSALVKMYLNGDFGDNPDDINIFAASTFYAVDRYASFATDWKKFYEDGGVVVSDRYTTSNMIHQGAKLIGMPEKRQEYLDWLWELEFVKFGLPVPNKVIFLDVKPEVSEKLMKERMNKITGDEKKDIHEKNVQFLKDSYDNAHSLDVEYDWTRIECSVGMTMLTREEIGEKIWVEVSKELV